MRVALLGAVPVAVVLAGGLVFGPGLLADVGRLAAGRGSGMDLFPMVILGAVGTVQLLWVALVMARR